MATFQQLIKSGAKRQDQIVFWIILGLLFSIYFYTAAPSVFDGDSGELSAVVADWGLAHPTGFPLYIILAKIFSTLIPVGGIAYSLNIFSALLVALAVGVFYFALRNFGISAIASVTSSLIFGFGQTIWSHAGSARVYSLNILFVTILLLLFAKYLKSKDRKFVFYYVLMLGLGFGAHSLVILMALPLAFMLYQNGWRNIYRVLLLLFIPLVQYIYLPIAYARNSVVNFGEMSTFGGFFHYITQQDFDYKTGGRDLLNTSEFFRKVASLFTQEFTIALLVIAAIGFLIVWKKRQQLGIVFSLIILLNILILYFYGNSWDQKILFRYFFTSYLLMAVFIAVAVDSFITKVGASKRWVSSLFVILILLTPLVVFGANFKTNNRHSNFIISDYISLNLIQNCSDHFIFVRIARLMYD